MSGRGYKSVDMFQNWKRLLLQWEARKSSSMVRRYCHDFEVEPAYYRYAQSLRSISENDKANQIMEKFDQMSETIEETFAKTKNMDAIKANSGRYKIEDAGINSPTPIMELPFMQIK
jgi:hypothetical protein